MRYINILGTQYEVIKQKEKENLKLKDANRLCEHCPNCGAKMESEEV